ncbi:MAG: hypothetical protein CMJ45_12450 [Planctomyces sp.]|nr:hypothetical protein [Planctomyces sp.]
MPESKNRRRRGRPVSRGQRAATSVPIARPQRKKANKLYVAASAIIAVLVIGGFAVGGSNFHRPAPTGSSSGEYVDGVGVQQVLMPTGPRGLNAHVDETVTVEYSTSPPTSGDHWSTPASCGFYEDGLPDERIVHNLEHGNIVISYNLSGKDEVDQLKDALDDVELSEIWGVTRSYVGISSGTVALAAWGVMDKMEGVDAERINTFFETYSGALGPERIICPGAAQQHNR